MGPAARYCASTTKALELVLWLASRDPGIDIYHVAKAAFFADKHHVTAYGRPICGDAYDAATYGPLPRVIYGLLRGDPLERLALGSNGPLPFDVDASLGVYAHREANARLLSESDVEALAAGLNHVRNKSFDDLYEETHGDPAYVNANGGRMDYRDFIPETDPDAAEKRAYIEETARYTAF